MMPVVTVRSKPNGLPMAIAGSPTLTLLESPSVSACSLDERGLTWSSARSVDGSLPTTVALMSWVSPKRTAMLVAPSTTWLFVRMSPRSSMTKPEPVEVPCSGIEKPNGEFDCWLTLAWMKATPGLSFW